MRLKAGYEICIVQDLLGHRDVSTTRIDTDVLARGDRGVATSLDRM
jgi:site-specific recombinase XerD